MIVPVYKSGDRSDVRNYRPVSLLCTVSKVPEKLIYDQIIEHVYSLLSDKQFGFLKGRSYALKLLSTLTYIVESLNKNYSLDIIFLDMQKALDSVCHNKLLLKLQAYGFVGESLAWFKGYLDNRQHCVRLDGCVSEVLPVKSGVPQGSILGPLLFLVYVDDLISHVIHSKLYMFADDSECIKEIRCSQDSVLLQYDLDSMGRWCNDNCMAFNAKKCALLHFGPEESSLDYTTNGGSIPLCTTHKSLGIIFSNKLVWSPHISFILGKAYRSLYLIKRVVPFNCDIRLKRTLYLTLVRSHLAYSSIIWRPHLLSDIKKWRACSVEQLNL